MASVKKIEQPDIADQKYRGPTTLAAGLGEGALETKFMLVGGLIAGGAYAVFFPKSAQKGVEYINKGLQNLKHSGSGLKSLFGLIGDTFFGFGRELANWTADRAIIKRNLSRLGSEEKVKVVIESSVTASSVLSMFGALFGGGIGMRDAMRGRKQFTDAKTEIVTLREQNTSLRQKLLDTQSDLEDALTTSDAKKGILKVANDEPPSLTPSSSPENFSAQLRHKPEGTWVDEVAARQQAASSDVSLA